MSTVVQPPKRSAPRRPHQPGTEALTGNAHRSGRLPLSGLARDALAVVGFAAAAEAVAFSVAAANWQPGSGGLPWLVGLAVALGFVFTRGRRTPWPFHLLAILVGLVVSTRVAASAFASPTIGWQTEIYAVLARLSDWVMTSLAGQMQQDDLLIALAVACFLFVWTYLCFVLALRARLAWLAAGLTGAALYTNLLFKPAAGGMWLALWAAGSLLLILSTNLQRQEWRRQRLAFPGWQRGSEAALAGGVLIAALTTLAFAGAPQVRMNQKLNELYSKLNGPIGQAQRAYNQLGVPKQYEASQIRYDSFQAQLHFLGPFRPGTALVMKVQSDRPRYEQAVVFDRYAHDGWTNTRFDQFENNSSDYNTLTALRDTSRDRDRKQIAQEITMVSPRGALLFAAPLPLGASVPLKGDGFGDLRATHVIQPNQRYTSASLESQATAESLAAVSGPIPDTIRSTYLQLPSDMPGRIKQLAEQQTAGKTTELAKATALESFIRTYPFDTEIPPPPAGRDGVDWFLFDERRGYCDYDASAMTVMLRSLGIPARIVAGYAPGQLDPADNLYHVTEKQTHTWTQAYFPGYGWIDFEPTPNNPLIQRPHSGQSQGTSEQSTPTPRPNATPTQGPGPAAAPVSSTGGTGGGGHGFPWPLLLVVAALAGAGWWLYSRLQGPPTARLAYARVALAGTLLGLRPHRWQTPLEYGRELNERRRFDRGATDTIAGLYSAERYAPRPLDESANRRAWTAWRRLKGRLLRPWRKPADQ